MYNEQSYFKDYPSSQECHKTSDGYIFHTERDASYHSHSLDDKTITKSTRAEIEAQNVEESKGGTGTEGTGTEGTGTEGTGTEGTGAEGTGAEGTTTEGAGTEGTGAEAPKVDAPKKGRGKTKAA